MDRSEELGMLRRAVEIAGLTPREMRLPEDRQLIANGMRLHYLDWGGGGRPMLLLHGGGLNAHTWDVAALVLSERFRCIALDQRGHGDSEWSPGVDYGVAAQVRDIEGVIDTLGLEHPLLVGQSMGGINAMACAIRRPERLKALVIVDVGPEIDATGTRRIREFASTPELDSPAAFLERAVKFNPLRDPAVLHRSLFYNLRHLPNGKWALKHDQRRAGEEVWRIAMKQREGLAGQLAKITCPTLIVRGALSDVLGGPGAEKFARSLPDGRWVEVERAGHNVQGDNPRGLLEAMVPFLDDIGA